MVAECEVGKEETNCRDVKGTGLGLGWMDVAHGDVVWESLGRLRCFSCILLVKHLHDILLLNQKTHRFEASISSCVGALTLDQLFMAEGLSDLSGGCFSQPSCEANPTLEESHSD